MVRMLIGVAAGLAMAATPALAAEKPPEKPPVVTQPDWLARPTGEDMAKRYPVLAARFEIEGEATLSCSVDVEGALADCTVPFESPRALGFGAAAIALAPQFKMRPMMVGGKAVAGGTVRIPIRFRLPSSAATEPPPAPSDEAMRQAQRLVDAFPYVDTTVKSLQRTVEADSDPNVTADTRKAATAAFSAAAEAHRGDLRDAFARAFASVFSEGELKVMADYAAGPGKAMQNRPQVAAVQGQMLLAYQHALHAGAHDAFCAAHACGSAADLARVWRPADPKDKRLDTPVWAVEPAAYEIRQRAPLLETIGLQGAVRLSCRVGKDGRLDGCDVDEQAPAGLGLGDAALALAGSYVLSPIQLADGGVGRKVTVRVGFAPALQADAPKPPAPRSPHALELARRLVDPEEVARNSKRDIEVQILKYQTRPKGADAKTWDAALDAYRAGGDAAVAAMVEISAANWAAAYTDDELNTQIAFHDTPAGRAQRERQPELAVAVAKAAAFVAEKMTADARDAFCATRGCARAREQAMPPVDPRAKTPAS